MYMISSQSVSQNTKSCSLFAGNLGRLPTMWRTYNIIDYMVFLSHSSSAVT